MADPRSISLQIVISGTPKRLDQAILDELRSRSQPISRSRLKELFETAHVLMEGKSRAPSWTLLPGSHAIELRGLVGDSANARPSESGSFLPVVYEDHELLVLNKFSGVPSLPHDPLETETAVGSALAHFPGLSAAITSSKPLEPGLLHRLDTDTSGLLAFAKTNSAFLRLKALWLSGEVRKVYRAWVEGTVNSATLPLRVELTLAHHPDSKKRMIVIPEGVHRKYRGKPLHTKTTLVRVHGTKQAHGKTWTDLEIEIETGVMHQIRCTLAHLKLPIAGDPIYSPSHAQDKLQKRLLLHAWKLTFSDGRNEKGSQPLEITAEIPSDFNPA